MISQFLLAAALSIMALPAVAQTPVVTNPTFSDDSYVHVPLQFGFPFYGRTFTNSWMHSNGVVSFLDPAVPIDGAAYNPAQWAYCCEGIRPTATTPQFSFMIAPLWTDLYPVQSSTFRTEGTTQYQLYQWNNIAEISNMNNLNTFGLEIRPTGYIGATYSIVNIQNQNTWIGAIGDPTQNQWNEISYGTGIVPGTRSNWNITDTGVDQCAIDPLSSPTCPDYTNTMCSANPLYSTTCSGYAAAYYSQQCSINTLYDPGCPGYAAAYYDYQCSADSLYHTGCPGYDVAYFDQQCGLDALYNTQCTGYADAYYIQQCTASPLYDVGCTGYATAFFDQQCGLDGLYSNQCPNYAEAYAKKNILNIGSSTPVADPAVIAVTTADQTPQLVADPVVNQAITSTTTSVSPATTATATVPLTPAPQAVAATTAAETKKEETKTEATTSTAAASSSSSSDKRDEPKTSRQVLAERRLATARAKAVEEGKNMGSKMGEAATMEAQMAVQNVVMAAMGFTPGFDAYGKVTLQDAVGYRPFEIYQGQRNIDNPSGRRFLTGADRLHQQMVDQQYGESK